MKKKTWVRPSNNSVHFGHLSMANTQCTSATCQWPTLSALRPPVNGQHSVYFGHLSVANTQCTSATYLSMANTQCTSATSQWPTLSALRQPLNGQHSVHFGHLSLKLSALRPPLNGQHSVHFGHLSNANTGRPKNETAGSGRDVRFAPHLHAAHTRMKTKLNSPASHHVLCKALRAF